MRDPLVIAAAILHDTIEDTETTPDELRGAFGATVAGIVDEVTDVTWLRKRARKKLQVARAGRASKRARPRQARRQDLQPARHQGPPPRDWTLERRREYFDWALSVVDGSAARNARLERKFDDVFRLRP